MDERVSASRIRARRRWVARTALLLAASGVVLVLLVIWHRDAGTVAALMRSNQRSTVAIQAHLDSTGLIPASLPGGDAALNYMYASYADRYYAQHTGRPVIIAATAPVSLILLSNGRAVIIHEKGKVRSEWMTASEFNEAYRSQLYQANTFEQQRRARIPRLP